MPILGEISFDTDINVNEKHAKNREKSPIKYTTLMIHQLLGGRGIFPSRVGNDDLMIKEEKQDSANEGD